MALHRALILAGIFLAATVGLYLSGASHHQRQTRVFVTKSQTQSEAEISQLSSYFQAACPELVTVNLESQADYSVVAVWGLQGWTVVLSRKGEDIFLKEGSTDAMETFRHTCTAIRGDEKEMADSEARTSDTGRYVLHSADKTHILLVDTKTGAVWELQHHEALPGHAEYDQFEHVSVEGIYNNRTF